MKSPRSGKWLERKHNHRQPFKARGDGQEAHSLGARSGPLQYQVATLSKFINTPSEKREKNYPKNIRTKHKSVPISTSREGKLHGTLERSLPQKRDRAGAEQYSDPNSHSLKSSCCPEKELGARLKFKNTVGQGSGGTHL